MPNPSVNIVEDDTEVRDYIVELVESIGLSAKAYNSVDSFLASFDPAQPGCIVSDVRMPGRSGLDLLKELTAQHVPVPLIIITGHADVAMAVNAVRDGAFDFLEKPVREQTLVETIQKAIEQDSRRRRALTGRREFDEKLASLSGREAEILELIIEGRTSKIIACDLGLSIKTVDFHRTNILRKFGVESAVDLVRFVLTNRPAGEYH